MSTTRTYAYAVAFVLVGTLLFLSCDSAGFVNPDPTTPPTPQAIRMDSIPDQIARDDSISLHATVLSGSGSPISGVTVDWQSSDGSVATVAPTSGTGALLVAQDQGTATITATYETLTTSKTVKVHRRPADLVYVSGSGQTADAGQTLPADLVVGVVDRRGDPVPDVDVSFVVVAGGGSVSPASGLTNADGQVSTAWTLGSDVQQQVKAWASEAQQSIQQLKDSVVMFTASTGAVARLALNVDSVDLAALGDTVAASVTGYDANDSVMSLATVTWSSSDTTVVTVNTNGVIRGRGNGSAQVQAVADGLAATANVRVQQVPASLMVVPAADTLTAVGDSDYLQATAYDSRGNVVPNATFNWTSTNSSVVEVNSMGRLMAMAAGTALVIVNTASCSDTAGVTVQTQTVADSTTPIVTDTTPPPPPSGLVLASTWTDSTQFTLTASWQSVPGAALYGWRTGSNDGSWSSQDTTSAVNATVSVPLSSSGSGYWLCVASVDTAGNTSTDGACGSYAAPAAPGGSDTASVATVTVSPQNGSVYVGGSIQLTATMRDANGNTLTGRSVSWTTSSSAIATVSGTGLVHGAAVGSATITATSEGQSGNATVQVVQQQTGSLAEPVYSSSSDELILRDNFDGYANMSQVETAYPGGRNHQYVSLVTGRGGSGHAIRLSYGPSTTDDILFGNTPTQLGSVGAWNGTLPQVGGPYDHLFYTSWFRTNPGANPTIGTNGTGGMKGFMFWHNAGGSGRYEFGVSTIAGCGHWYSEPRGPSEADSNDCTGYDIYKTLDGGAPLWSNYNDGNWHRITFEIYTSGSGHAGARVWIDGTLTEDFVDLPGGYADYSYPVQYIDVWGNGWQGAPAVDFTIDFDDWTIWTN